MDLKIGDSASGIDGLDDPTPTPADDATRNVFAKVKTSVEAAVLYLGMRLAVVPVARRSKRCPIKNWPSLRIQKSEVPKYFTAGRGVAILDGEPSANRVDVDLDSDAARRLADHLPETEFVWGRRSAPRSHHLFQVDDPPKRASVSFKDPLNGESIAEIRSTGGMSILPPSVHVSGEQYQFDLLGEPSKIDYQDLHQSVAMLASAALIAAHWPAEGSRNDAALALGGALLRKGMDVDAAAALLKMGAEAAGDEEADSRAATVATTSEKLSANEPTTGAPRFAGIVDGGDKILSTIATWLTLKSEIAPSEDLGSAAHPYLVHRGMLSQKVSNGDKISIVPLANFDAQIIREEAYDDGSDEPSTTFVIRGSLSDGEELPLARVLADRFPMMHWPIKAWGSRAVVRAGYGVDDHLRAAIQHLSEKPERITIYGHTGWRKLEERWVYLSAGGAIGADGAVPNIEVDFGQSRLSDFSLPTPPEGDDLRQALRDCLILLRVAPERVVFPLFAAVWRSVLGAFLPIDLSVFVVGATGAQKSELTALCQQFFGGRLTARNLPANWDSTANSLQRVAFQAKDCLLVVDDFAPAGSQSDVQRLHQQADRLLRSQGNRSGRGRMRPDGSLSRVYFPRSLIVSSGEDLPRGQSLRARMLVLEVSPGQVDLQELTTAQELAASGRFAQAMAGFVRWLAPLVDSIRDVSEEFHRRFRAEARTAGGHDRIPDNVASLRFGLEMFVGFAKDVGALSESEGEEILLNGSRALAEAAGAQTHRLQKEDPADRYIDLLRSLYDANRIYYRRVDQDRWEGPQPSFGHQGTPIGWVDGDEVLIDPEVAYAEVQRLARDQGAAFTVSEQTLRQRLREKGYLSAYDKGRLTVLRTVGGVRRHLLSIPRDLLFPPENKLWRAVTSQD